MNERPLVLDSLAARRVELVGLDVDGVLTDAGVYVGSVGNHAVEMKRFDIQDGIGIKLLRQAGIKVVVISGRVSEATTIRMGELGIDEVVQDDMARKLPAFTELLERFDIRFENAAFIGDDLPDLPVMWRVGLPVAVRNAVHEVKSAAHLVTEARGGNGAVREFAVTLLRARGQWDELVEAYLAERGEASPRLSGANAPA
jgi:3-deoxy-D-manno-octulosonate 8-phosphate phosphatase (KDO 8-P phosphatase)